MKAKRKLYSGHGVMLEQSPSADDFRNDGNNNTRKLPVKEGCNMISTPPTGRKKNEGRLSRKSSVKRKLLQCSSLSLQRGMRNDGGDASELMQRIKSDRCGPRTKSSIEPTNTNKRKEGDKNIGLTQTLQGNPLESEASDYDFSLLCEVASPKNSQNCRHNSTGSGTSGCSINEDWVTGADQDTGLKDHVQSTEAAEQLHGLRNQPDVTETLETQEMFITQKDTKPKPNKGLPHPFGASRILKAEGNPRRMRPANKQHRTVSQVKQLKRGTITQAVMIRHSSCPQQFLISPFSQYQNKGGARAKLFLRKVKELQEKRRIVDSQISTLAESQGDSQLASSGELSVSPQDLGCGTQMFNVSSEDQEPVVTDSQSLIPPMVADDDSEEDTFKEVLSMRLESRKRQIRHKNRSIFGWSPLEEVQEEETGDPVCDEERSEEGEGDKDISTRSPAHILDTNVPSEEREPLVNVSESDEETVKNGTISEFSTSQSTLSKKEGDLFKEPTVKQGIGSVAKEDVDIGSSDTNREDGSSVTPTSDTRDCNPTDNARHLVGEEVVGVWIPTEEGDTSETKGNDEISAAKSKKGNDEVPRMKDLIVLETQSERTEPGNDGETVTQQPEVTIVPDSHDVTQSSLPRYHFTSDEETSDELHDESVTEAVSNFLNTFEDSGDEKPPWKETEGQLRRDGASREKKDHTEENLKRKGSERAKDSRQHVASSSKSDRNSSKTLDESIDVSLAEEGGDQLVDDFVNLDESLCSGPVTRKKAEKMNIKIGDSVVSDTSRVSQGVMKKLSHCLGLSVDRKRSVRTEKDRDSNLLKKGSKLHKGSSVIPVRVDVHVPDIPMAIAEVNEGTDSITSPLKKNSSSANSSQSRNNEGIECPVEILIAGTGRESTVNAGNDSADLGDSSRETCLPDDDNVGSDAERLSSGSSCDEDEELGERKMFVGEVSSSVDTVGKVASPFSAIGGGTLESSTVGLAGPSRGECGRCNRTNLRATSTQTVITLQDLQSQEYFDFCIEFKRLLVEYDKSVITTSGSGSFGSSTSDSEAKDKAEELMVLVRRVADSRVRDKTLASEEAVSDRLKRRKRKRKMVESSCQIGSPSKGLEKSTSTILSPKTSSPKEDLWDRWTDQSIDVEEIGGLKDKYINASENPVFVLDVDVSSSPENPAAENSSEGKRRKVKQGKIKNKKKRKKNHAAENSLEGGKEQLKKHKSKKGKKNDRDKVGNAEKKKSNRVAENLVEGRNGKLEEGKTKKRKKRKKNHAAENSLEGGREQLEEQKIEKGKKTDGDKVENAERKKDNDAAENFLEGRNGKLEERKTKKGKKRKKNHAAENSLEEGREQLEEQKTEKGKKNDGDNQGKAKKRKKEHRAAENSVEGRNGKLEEGKTKKGKKNNEMKYLGKTKKKKKSKNSKETFSLFDIPIESLPSPEELRRQRKEKKRGGETLGVSNKRNNFSFFDIPVESLSSPDELKSQRKEKKFHKEALRVSSSDGEVLEVSSERNEFSGESLPSQDESEPQQKERSDGEALGTSSKENDCSLFDIPVESLPSPDELKRQQKEKKFHKETVRVSSSDGEVLEVSSERNEFSGESLPSQDESEPQQKEKSDGEALGASSKENDFSLFDIPVESLPSPDELKRQRKEKKFHKETVRVSSKGNMKKRKKKSRQQTKMVKEVKVSKEQVVSSDFDSTRPVTDLEMGYSKKKKKMKKKRKDPEKVKASKQKLLYSNGGSSDNQGNPERRKEETESGKRKEVNKPEKKKRTSDDEGDLASKVLLQEKSAALTSGTAVAMP